MGQDKKGGLFRPLTRKVGSKLWDVAWISVSITIIFMMLFLTIKFHMAANEQRKFSEMEQEYQEMMETFYWEHEKSFECAKEPFSQDLVIRQLFALWERTF